MLVTIIGPGAVGLFIAHRLIRQGVSLGFVGPEGPRAVHQSFRAYDGLIDLRVPAPTSSELGSSDLAFVVVKAFQLAEALQATRQQKPGTAVIVLVNGAIHEVVEREQKRSPHLLWRLGSCTFGVSRTEGGIYEQRSQTGEILLGPLSPEETPTNAEEFIIQKDPEVFAWRPEMMQLYRRKWLFNTVINTLCAAHRLPRNGELLKDLPLVAAVFDEAYRLGVALWGAWSFGRESLYLGVVDLIRATAANENSMARDVRLGRRTESEFLAGLAKDVTLYPLLSEFHERIMRNPKKPGLLTQET
jgi:2-dehydropantoate 2-reductase